MGKACARLFAYNVKTYRLLCGSHERVDVVTLQVSVRTDQSAGKHMFGVRVSRN